MRIGCIGDSLTQGVLGSAYVTRLRAARPEDTFVNLGVGGDTVSSLLKRIRHLPDRERFDLAILWVGVNDIVSGHEPIVRITGSLAPQHPAESMVALQRDYAAILDIVRACTPKVVAVSPLLKGERADGLLNRHLGAVVGIVKEQANLRRNVTFLDLHTGMMALLRETPGPDYLLGKPLRVLWDVITARNDEIIDQRASERGYAYSLDGLHLNSRGADYVAERMLREIERVARRSDVSQSAPRRQPERAPQA